MEGAGKGSECGKVRVHRNIKSKSVAKTLRGGKRVRVRKGSKCIEILSQNQMKVGQEYSQNRIN